MSPRSPKLKTLGYLCSEFPALSHTFISREISILEREGFTIHPASINQTRNLEKMGADDQARAKTTFYVKGVGKLKLLGTVFQYFLNLPRFFAVLFFALGLAWFKGPASLTKAVGYFLQAILLHSWARKKGLNHIHVHFANPAASVALIATRFGRLEFSLSVHGPDEFYDVERNSLRQKIEAAVFVRTIGHFCSSQLMRLSPLKFWNKFHIVRCGLYKDEFTPRPARSGKLKSILCVGRLCPSKGQAVLLDAAEVLLQKGLNFHFTLLGGGEYLETIREQVATRNLDKVFTVAGPVGHDRVKAELAATDLFVLPSFAEGIPVALMEAMAAGVPVVTTNITGIPELIDHGKSGWLTQAANSAQLADVLADLLEGKVDTAPVLQAAAEKIRTEYDVEANTKKLGQLFGGLK